MSASAYAYGFGDRGASNWKTERRRSLACCVGAGAPLAVVGRLLGHRNLRSTQRYSHATKEGLRDAV